MKNAAPILAGIDFSESSPSVLRHAVHASGKNNNPVVALHVIDASSVSHWAATSGSDPSDEALEESAGKKLASWVESQGGADQVQIEIRRGNPAAELHQAVVDHGASILTIAANDTTKKRLGSIASRCVRSAPCDVMVLRDWQTGDFKRIVVCCDFSPTSLHAIEEAAVIARENHAELEIVHVMYPPSRDLWGEALEDDDGGGSISFAERCRGRIQDSMVHFLEPHREALSKVVHKSVILESTVPSVTLTHYVQDHGADLVVLGTRGHSRLMSHFIGTNAERLMHDCPVSVLAVRSPKD